MKWNELNELNQLDQIIVDSASQTQAIFKHSTRCIISKTVKRQFEAEWSSISTDTRVYHLDLIARRDISNAIAERLDVVHQSPQLIVIKEGKAISHSSHQHISAKALNPV